MTTPRITPLTPDQAAPDVRPIFETYMKERGNVPNMFRTVALRPSHLRTKIAHFRTVMNDGTDELYGRLRGFWDEGQVVEITLVIGMTEYFNRFNNSLRVEPTK